MIDKRILSLSRDPARRMERDELTACKGRWKAEGGRVAEASGNNPLCGDDVVLAVVVDGTETVRDVRWSGYGCSLCVAAVEAAAGMALGRTAGANPVELDEVLEALGGPQIGRSRRACAALPVSALREAVAACLR